MRTRATKARMVIVAVIFLTSTAVITFFFLTAPKRNTDAEHFDCILVLGTPAKTDGTPSKAGRWLVTEAVREYRAGRAAHVVISGAAVANRYVEADVLARLAKEMGISPDAVLEERRARDTLQNVDNTADLMKQHGWTSVEVIGMPEHLHRAGVLLEHTSLQWSTHAAPTPGRNVFTRALRIVVEACGTTVLRVFGLRAVPVLHCVKSLFWRS